MTAEYDTPAAGAKIVEYSFGGVLLVIYTLCGQSFLLFGLLFGLDIGCSYTSIFIRFNKHLLHEGPKGVAASQGHQEGD